MIKLITHPIFFLFSISWVYPTLIMELFRIQKYGATTTNIILLVLGVLFSYLMLNLRRDRIDVSKHYEILSFIKKYEDSADFKLKETEEYFDESKLEKFIKAYGGTGLLSVLVKGKASKFVNNRIRMVLVLPKIKEGKKRNGRLPSGFKSFPSYVTHQTTIFTVNYPDKLNPLSRFYVNHELGHMHKYALSNVSMREIGTFPFLWFLLWAVFNVTFNIYSIVIMLIILLIIVFSELKNEDSKIDSKERVDAEVASDYMGLKLLSKKDLNHNVFDKVTFSDQDLSEEVNDFRNKTFKLILDKIRQNENYELPSNFRIRKRVLVLIILAISLSYFVIESSNELVKFGFIFLVFIQTQRFVNHREINRVLVNIKDRTGVDLSRFRKSTY